MSGEWLADNAESEPGDYAAAEDPVAVAMRMVADAQRDLIQVVTRGAMAVAERQRALAIALGAQRPAADARRSAGAHLILPHPMRSGSRDPRPGEVVVRLLRGAAGRVMGLTPDVGLVDVWAESDPPMVLLRVRGPVDAVRAAFPGASEFDGPEQAL